MQGIISFGNSSVSSLYGCIGYTVQDMLLNQFPNEYFKSRTMSSELATRNMRRLFGVNTDNEIQKRQKPSLFIQPTYADTDRSEPLQGIPLTSNFDNLQYRTDKRYLFEVIKDKEFGYGLKFRMNRDRIDYDITIALSTLHQQLDIYKMIKNEFLWDRPFSSRIALESVIPKPLIGQISKLCHMDLEQHEDYIPVLLRHLNKVSGYPITYKIRNASATDEWFMYYVHNVIFTYSDLQIEAGTRKGMSEDRFPITFRISAEFNLPAVYFLEGETQVIETIDLTLKTKEYSEENDAYIPIFTVSNLYSKFPPEKDGMMLYGTSLFKTDVDPRNDGKHPQAEDRISLKGVLDDDHIRVLRAHRAWNMNPETLINVFVLLNNENLTYEQDFKIDWNTMELVIYRPDPTATYRIAIYFNYGMVNEILNNTEYLNVRDTDTLRENRFPEEGLPDNGSYLHINGTPMNQPMEVENGGVSHKPPQTIDPELVLRKDKILIDTGDAEFMVSDHLVPPGQETGAEDEATSVPGDYDDAFDPMHNHGIPAEMIHPATPPPEPPPPPFESKPLDEMSEADIYNTQVMKPSTSSRFSSSVSESKKETASTKKKFSSST